MAEDDREFLARLADELRAQGRYTDAKNLNRFVRQHFEALEREEARMLDEMQLRCVMDGKPGVLIGRFIETEILAIPSRPEIG